MSNFMFPRKMGYDCYYRTRSWSQGPWRDKPSRFRPQFSDFVFHHFRVSFCVPLAQDPTRSRIGSPLSTGFLIGMTMHVPCSVDLHDQGIQLNLNIRKPLFYTALILWF